MPSLGGGGRVNEERKPRTGHLAAAGQATNPVLSFGLGFGVSCESANPTLAGHRVAQPKTRISTPLAVGNCLDFAMSNDLRGFHFLHSRFSPFLCQICFLFC